MSNIRNIIISLLIIFLPFFLTPVEFPSFNWYTTIVYIPLIIYEFSGLSLLASTIYSIYTGKPAIV